MMLRQVSRPMKSARVNGPIGTFVPSFRVLSMSSRTEAFKHIYIYIYIDYVHQSICALVSDQHVENRRVLRSANSVLKREDRLRRCTRWLASYEAPH